MYGDFYGFACHPFYVTPDPRFLFETNDHRDALAYLHYGVKERAGFLVLTGEVGVGKTICLRTFMRQLVGAETALVLNTSQSFRQLLVMVLEDLGLDGRGKTQAELLIDLNQYLLKAASIGRETVLIVDEAQNLSASVLEGIRQLSNLETDDRKLLTIILSGQPELGHHLARHDLRQLRQRIPGICSIRPLSVDEERGYVEHRIRVASAAEPRVRFTEGAIEWIHAYAVGVPRLINVLCDRALLVGYVEEKTLIDHGIVRSAVRELERGSSTRRRDLALRAG